MNKRQPERGKEAGPDASRIATLTQQKSPFMARQAERAHMTGLSPIEEMRLAQNELRAKAASRLPPAPPEAPRRMTLHKQFTQTSLMKLVTMRDMIRKAKNRAKVAAVRPADGKIGDFQDQRLERDMDDLTPAEALDFVETVSKNEILINMKKQKFDESAVPKYIISPHCKFRVRWDLLSVTLICYNSISIPFQLSFGASVPQTIVAIDYIQRVIDCFFILDIFINFMSAYEERGRIEVKVKGIARRYIKSWFLLDFISAFPLYYIQGSYFRIPQLARMFRLLRLFRLVRMLTITRILNRLDYALLLRSTVSSIFKFCMLVCFTSHWLSYDEDDGWVANMELQDKGMYEKYVTSFYWAIMTMTTVGYGDVHPTTTYERLFAIVAMILGAWIFAYGITNVVAMVTNLNMPDSRFQLRMDELNDYMEARELPMQLRYEIREFFFNARISAESKLVNEGKILAELSALLRSKIAFAINDSVLNKMPFFAGADHNFLMELALSMRMVCFPPLEEVILEGEIGEEMFFIFRGVVEIVKSGVQLGLLGQKQYFGEMAILNQNCLRTATVRTLCFCELRMLTREKFLIALTHYPAMKQRIARIVDKRTKTTPKTLSSKPTESSLSALEKMAASMVIDANTAQQLVTPTPETTLNRISQLNSDFSGSFRSQTAESELEKIQTKISSMIHQQDRLGRLVQDLEKQMHDVTEAQNV
ncbi:Potassium voltage-gated channel subfamily H member 2 [Phytophthora ramorum]|uniref:Potassium voltage-gated channel subfamily H member 2 n=1 Tax=Phytophthora ramorum TaxID=164328 RepID=UPI0030A3CCC6|nr:Potassium voltage-gated channel subfamily H member 2 [Phytophthora ramorum]